MGNQLTLAHTGFAGGHTAAHTHPGPLSRRLMLEILLTMVAAAMAIAATFGFQVRNNTYEASSTVSFGINASAEPIQMNIYPFQESIMENGTEAVISGENTYTINAKVQSTRAYDDSISAVIPYDYLLAWGDMADENKVSGLTWEQESRHGMVSGNLGGSGIGTDYVVSHVSNNHLIPANATIRKALAQVKPGDMVRIEGRLVNVKIFASQGRTLGISSSQSRTDQGDGACEVIYVEQIKINGEIF